MHGHATTDQTGIDTGPSSVRAVVTALRTLREVISGYATQHPQAQAILHRIDDHVLPRMTHPDAPMLVVVGGSTGAGKSTLVNSVVSAPVSQASARRPTTLTPMIVCHPSDLPWFTEQRILADLSEGAEPAVKPDERLASRPHLIGAPGLPLGLALLDAPDLDSVVRANRQLSGRLANAADLWLFVTTAARYADAAPWAALRAARAWGTPVALVLNRVPDGADIEIGEHLGQLMSFAGLSHTPLLHIPETALTQPGLLPEPLGDALRAWLTGLVCAPDTRTALRAASRAGGIEALVGAARRLAAALPSGTRVHAAAQALAHAWAGVPADGFGAAPAADPPARGDPPPTVEGAP